MVLTPTVLPNSFGVPPDLSFPYLFQARGLPRYGFCALEMPQALLIPVCLVCGQFLPPVLLIFSIIPQTHRKINVGCDYKPQPMLIFIDFFGLCRILFFSVSEYRRLPEKPGKQRHQRDADQCHTATGHELFYPQSGVKLCLMAGGGVQKIYMVFLREPSRRTGQAVTCSTSGIGLRLK